MQNLQTMTLETVRHHVRQACTSPAGLCVLTGAGMSAESGIPTFRDALTGHWARFDPMDLASEEGFRADPARVWNWYAERRDGVRRAEPNAGHLALVAFAARHPGVPTEWRSLSRRLSCKATTALAATRWSLVRCGPSAPVVARKTRASTASRSTRALGLG